MTSTLCSAAPRRVGGSGPPGRRAATGRRGRAPARGRDAGQIQVRGANLFSGYWPDGSGGPDPEAGGRPVTSGSSTTTATCSWSTVSGELVIVSGFNVYPTEVEDVVAEVPGVSDVGVIGVEDPRTGEAVVAYVRADSTAGDPAALVEAVHEHCARRLARGSSARPGSRWSRSCRRPSPARSRRAGSVASSGAVPSG